MSSRHQDNRLALVAIIAAVTAMAVALSLSIPLVSLSMERRGYGSDLIGIMGAMPAVAFLFGSPFIPTLTRLTGAGTMLWSGLVLSAACILALAISDNIIFWFFLRLIIGFGMATLFLISETWINTIAREETRGRTIGIYVSVMTCGFAAGPILINFIGAEGALPFIISGLIVLSAGFAFLLVGDRFPNLSEKGRFPILRFVKIAPMVTAATLLVSFFDGSVLSLLPVYGVKNGQLQEVAVLMTTALLAGNILLQVPIGWLADKLDRTVVMLGCGILSALGAVMLPYFINNLPILLWPMLLIWGGFVVGTYTIALAAMGEHFRGGDLITATAAVSSIWGLGTLLGPSMAGTAMEVVKPHGMPYSFAAISVIFILICLYQFSRDRKAENNP